MRDRNHGPDGAAAEPVGREEVRRLATGGAALLAGRSLLVLALGVGANIALARLLAPRDFGLVALGTVLLVLTGYLAESGVSAALVRRQEAPTNRQLEAINGLQLGVTALITLATAAAALPFGRDGLVVATMVAGLPITILRAPSVLVLERRLDYRLIATVDVVDAVAFYAWSIVTVALGMGVWGMATGLVVRAVAGTAVMIGFGPLGLVRPRWDWQLVRPLLSFGVKLQGIAIVAIVREQVLNIAVAAIAGVATLGVWNLAFRVLRAPSVLFATVGRITYPTMSRILAAGRDPRSVIERGVATLTVATGVVLVAIAGFAPALTVLAGDAWSDVPPTLGLSCLAIVVSAPVYVFAVGYLYAADAAGAVLRAMSVYALVWFAVTLPLVSLLGAPAIGLGWIAGGTVNALQLSREATGRTGAAIAASLLPPAAIAVVAGASGFAIATAAGETVLAGVLGAAAGELVLLAGLALLRRALLRDAFGLLMESIRGARAPREAAVEPAPEPSPTTSA